MFVMGVIILRELVEIPEGGKRGVQDFLPERFYTRCDNQLAVGPGIIAATKRVIEMNHGQGTMIPFVKNIGDSGGFSKRLFSKAFHAIEKVTGNDAVQ